MTLRIAWLLAGMFGAVVAGSFARKWLTAMDELTYEEAITYFVQNKPPIPFEKGALMRKSGFGGIYRISQVFLDKNDEILRKPDGSIYGRNVSAKKIDQELLTAFGNKNVIIVM